MVVNYLLSVRFFNIESRNDKFLDVCTRPYELPQYKPFEGDTKNSFVSFQYIRSVALGSPF